MSEILSDADVRAFLAEHPDWSVVDGRLERRWSFRHFRAGFAFLTEAALLFERQNHHGDVHLTYRHVSIWLTSHDVGGLTLRDVRMVEALDKIREK